MGMKKCALVCNPNSGHNKKKPIIEKMIDVLKDYDYETEVYYTKYSGHAKKIIMSLKDDIDLVVSLGGDGTFNEVVTGNFKRPKKLLLSHIPLGTTNDLGAIFGLGKNPITNLKMILEGTVKGIDICMINDQPFVYVAGLGKFTDVAYNTPRRLKKNFGYMAYMFNALKSFNQKTHLFEMSYEIDGEVYTGLYSFALVCNARRMAGINVFQDVKMDDGKFEVLFSNITAKKDIIKSLYYFKANGIKNVPGFYFFRTDNLKIRLKDYPKNNWCIDGEKLRDRSLTFDIKIVKGLEMLLPNKELKNIFIS